MEGRGSRNEFQLTSSPIPDYYYLEGNRPVLHRPVHADYFFF